MLPPIPNAPQPLPSAILPATIPVYESGFIVALFDKILEPTTCNLAAGLVVPIPTLPLPNRFNKLFPHLAQGDHYFDKYNISEPLPFDFNKKYTKAFFL